MVKNYISKRKCKANPPKNITIKPLEAKITERSLKAHQHITQKSNTATIMTDFLETAKGQCDETTKK